MKSNLSKAEFMEECMLEKTPDLEDIKKLLGDSLFAVWTKLSNRIDEKYEIDCIWDKDLKEWPYELKYSRGGKTLCTFYLKEHTIGFWIILGKNERMKFENDRDAYSREVQNIYDETKTYHDGKWLMFEPTDDVMFDDFMKLLAIKRKPNR